MKKVLFFISIFMFSSYAYCEETISQLIGPVNFNGSESTSFYRGASKWGAPSCPNATYVQVRSNVPGYKEILSIALAAKMAGKKVQFWGSCDTDPNYFTAFYVVIVE